MSKPPRVHDQPAIIDLDNLPAAPSADLLRKILRGNVVFAGAKPAAVPVPPNLGSYLSWSDFSGEPFSPSAMIKAFSAWSWKATLASIALVAAMLANGNVAPEPVELARILKDPLLRHAKGVHPTWAAIGRYVASKATYPLAHEQVIYFLAAMAVLYGADEGPPPSPDLFAVMFLAGNDFLSNWAEPDNRPLTKEEAFVAEFCHYARFNRHRDPVRDLARASLIYSRAPRDRPLSEQATWTAIQERACGTTFERFFSTFVLPLQFETTHWGTEKSGQLTPSIVEPRKWYSQTKIQTSVGEAFLEQLALGRDEARSKISERLRDGLPHSPTLFFSRPFIRLDSDRLLAISPWAVRQQLQGGLYKAFADAVNERFGRKVWPPAFGYLFEEHCREVARMALRRGRVSARLLESRGIGTEDELEDVIILEDAGCTLVSVKGKLVAERVARQAQSRTGLLEWYEDFLFKPRPKGDRAGALRLLDSKVARIRRGEHPSIPADLPIAPVLVTFDDLADNPALSRWIAHRCRSEGLFAQSDVLPPVLAPVTEFERLMGMAANGTSPAATLRGFAKSRAGHLNLNNYLLSLPAGRNVRLRELEEEFDRVADLTKESLF